MKINWNASDLLERHFSNHRLGLTPVGADILRAVIRSLHVADDVKAHPDLYRKTYGDSTVEAWAPDWYHGPGPDLVVTIEKYTDDWQRGGFTVRCGDKYETRLERGEAMDMVNRMIYDKSSGGPQLRTQAEHDEYDAKWGHKHQPTPLYQRLLAAPAAEENLYAAQGLDPYYYARDHERGPGAWCVRGPGMDVPVPEKGLAYAVGKLLSGDVNAALEMLQTLYPQPQANLQKNKAKS